jgi:hypothetical protein
MSRSARRIILVLANLPFLAAGRSLVDNSLFGFPLFMDVAAIPLCMMGLGVTWIATLVLLSGYLLPGHPPPR